MAEIPGAYKGVWVTRAVVTELKPCSPSSEPTWALLLSAGVPGSHRDISYGHHSWLPDAARGTVLSAATWSWANLLI